MEPLTRGRDAATGTGRLTLPVQTGMDDAVRAAGKETMMFLGDSRIGYGGYLPLAVNHPDVIGVGAACEHARDGVTFQLADALGVDREIGWGLSTNRPRSVHLEVEQEHFVTADLTAGFDGGEGTPTSPSPGTVPVPGGPRTIILEAGGQQWLTGA